MITVSVSPVVRSYPPDSFPAQWFEFADRERATAEAFADRARLEGYRALVVVGPPRKSREVQ